MAHSVPSTPFQQPRDLRFHSRSPSPNRGLSNQSPRSVVSEAVGQTGPGPQRGAPVVCKFETGAEFRKRRIPYTEGGDDELGPPKKQPKKTLEPDEEDKLSGDTRELYDRLLPSQESEERRALLVKKLDNMLNDEWPGNDIRVNVFGSSGNLLSSSDSDVDICITTPMKKLESMHSLAMLLHKNGMEKVVCRASAKVPIVKCWDPELMLACDLNVNNPLALENTRMIKTYVQLDDRVRPLAKIIKYWTKRRILNDAAFGGTISSYTWICMIINFLQRRDPPIIPSLQKVEGKRLKSDKAEPSQFADDIEALSGCGDANTESLAQLLFQFFRHYGYEFDYSKYVVSVKEGRLLSREEKGWQRTNYWDKEAQKRLCVEEPFTLNRNLGNSADEYSWSGVHNEIRRAFDLLAEGQQLEKCCEQYEFPHEEKPVFQRPPPKPAPTLRRSASQSGRSNHEPGSGRSRKPNNRNQSTQRAGNRRASSGASYGNQRVPLPFQSPPAGATPADYFANKSNLHDQLFQQYQYLQAQQDVLRSQLAQHAHQQQQAQGLPSGRVGDLTGSPRHRSSFTNGLPSPRFLDNPPQTAPLLPGYLYHYPARYPPPSPMSQTRSREGTSTNPSSPSLISAVPALRRQIHRASVPDGSSSSNRSQSQPGRSLPHPLTLQQHAHPGYDVSGAIPAQYQNLRYMPGQPGLQVPYSPMTAMHAVNGTNGASVESAMPKEYVGYYVGQSPSLGPQQYATSNPMQMQMPPMTLRDPPPQRQRRVTPDLMPPMPNGRHNSRSPSPLGHLRSYSTIADLRPRAQAEALQSPSSYETPIMEPPVLPTVPVDLGGPLIVNGSTPSSAPKSAGRANGVPATAQPEVVNGSYDGDLSRVRSLPFRTAHLEHAQDGPERLEVADRTPPSPQISASPRMKAGPKLSLSPNGTPHVPNGLSEHFHDLPLTAPLLSPVAELRTPSPTQAHAFDKHESPQVNGFMKATMLAKAKQAGRDENDTPPAAETKHERKGSAPNPAAGRPARSPTALTPTSTLNATATRNEWQQATRKGHKKSKSTVAPAKNPQGQPIPVNEFERKGG
ncbi:hypothetical protein LTR85_005162 [Meristemomyces frigidus]|nr:hypothetical protein LTR85_005162 [Meristemomyces frigidus]